MVISKVGKNHPFIIFNCIHQVKYPSIGKYDKISNVVIYIFFTENMLENTHREISVSISCLTQDINKTTACKITIKQYKMIH